MAFHAQQVGPQRREREPRPIREVVTAADEVVHRSRATVLMLTDGERMSREVRQGRDRSTEVASEVADRHDLKRKVRR